jgi:hypothetical protein
MADESGVLFMWHDCLLMNYKDEVQIINFYKISNGLNNFFINLQTYCEADFQIP